MFEVLICLLIINVKRFFLQYTNYVHKVLCNLIHRHLNIEQYFSKHIYQEPDARLWIRNRICALFELYMTNRFQILSIQLVCLALGFANVFGCIALICKRDDLSLINELSQAIVSRSHSTSESPHERTKARQQNTKDRSSLLQKNAM